MSTMINTPYEADAVTVGSVVMTANDVIAQRSTSKHALLFGFETPVRFDGLQLPLVVLYEAPGQDGAS